MPSKYKLKVQLIGYDKTNPDMAICQLSIISPDGVVQKFMTTSGPYGNGAFPGLQNEFHNVSDENINAIFKLQNQKTIKRVGEKFNVHGDDEGYFLNILTPKTGRTACGIHPDRGVSGTMGCLGLVAGDDAAFREAWKQIPKEQLPDELVVLKPKFHGEKQVINIDISKDKVATQEYRRKHSLLCQSSKGEDVETLQTALKYLGFYESEPDGDFGKLTKKAVMQFQKEHGLQVDGIVGSQTMGKLKERSKEILTEVDINFQPAEVNSANLDVVVSNLASAKKANRLLS